MLLSDLGNPFVHHTGEAFIASFRSLTAERGGEPSQGRFSLDEGRWDAIQGQFVGHGDPGDSPTHYKNMLVSQFFAPDQMLEDKGKRLGIRG